METHYKQYQQLHNYTFLPYLWGMETSLTNGFFGNCYNVLTVPMRNGNFLKNKREILQHRVLTVPMRNGNLGWTATERGFREGSYRTYEEWKQLRLRRATETKNRSYRTYEEWKLVVCFYEWDFPICSYRTYEEWKRVNISFLIPFSNVLTVPMRNGNIINYSISGILKYSFLPYLWGMETYYRWC